MELEEKLHKREQEHEGQLQQLGKAPQVEDSLLPQPEALDDLKLEVRDSIMNVQNLVETHDLRTADVSGAFSFRTWPRDSVASSYLRLDPCLNIGKCTFYVSTVRIVSSPFAAGDHCPGLQRSIEATDRSPCKQFQSLINVMIPIS